MSKASRAIQEGLKKKSSLKVGDLDITRDFKFVRGGTGSQFLAFNPNDTSQKVLLDNGKRAEEVENFLTDFGVDASRKLGNAQALGQYFTDVDPGDRGVFDSLFKSPSLQQQEEQTRNQGLIEKLNTGQLTREQVDAQANQAVSTPLTFSEQTRAEAEANRKPRPGSGVSAADRMRARKRAEDDRDSTYRVGGIRYDTATGRRLDRERRDRSEDATQVDPAMAEQGLQELMRINPELANRILESRGQSAQPTAAQNYTVQPGDTLGAIAQRHGVSINDITGFRSGDPNLIYPGEVLNIGGGQVPGTGSSGGSIIANEIQNRAGGAGASPAGAFSDEISARAGGGAQDAITQQLIQALADSTPTRSLEEQYDRLRRETGADAAQEAIGTFDEEIGRAKEILDTVEQRVQGGLDKEAARLAPMEVITGRQEEILNDSRRETQALVDTLQSLSDSRGLAYDALDRADKEALTRLGFRQEDLNRPLERLETEINLRGGIIDLISSQNPGIVESSYDDNGNLTLIMQDPVTGAFTTREFAGIGKVKSSGSGGGSSAALNESNTADMIIRQNFALSDSQLKDKLLTETDLSVTQINAKLDSRWSDNELEEIAASIVGSSDPGFRAKFYGNKAEEAQASKAKAIEFVQQGGEHQFSDDKGKDLFGGKSLDLNDPFVALRLETLISSL